MREKINKKVGEDKISEKLYSLDEVEDILIGEKGTSIRDEYEIELADELAGEFIKKLRKKRHLTQTELGERVGVQKAQISKLEKNTGSITVSTFNKLLNVLGAKLKVELINDELIDDELVNDKEKMCF